MNTFTLSNGLRVVHVPMDRRSVLVSFSGIVGRHAEQDSEVGAAHFLEHLLFDGTVTRPSAQALGEFEELHGIKRNGSTGSEIVDYWAESAQSQAEYAFAYLADITQHSLLRQEDIEKEKKVIAQEAAQRRSEPSNSLGRFIRSDLLSGQSVGRTIFDEEAHLATMSQSTLRAYMSRVYGAQNFVLGIGGGITEKDARVWADSYFSSFPVATESIVIPSAHIAAEKATKHFLRDIAQAHVSLTVPYIGRAAQDYTQQSAILAVLGRILVNSSTGRLYQRARHAEHLVYWIRGGAVVMQNAGWYELSFSATPEHIPRIFSCITEEAQKFIAGGVTEDELERAKIPILANLEMSLDSYNSEMDERMSSMLFNIPYESVASFSQRIRSVSSQDVVQLMCALCASPCRTYILGPESANIPGPATLAG